MFNILGCTVLFMSSTMANELCHNILFIHFLLLKLAVGLDFSRYVYFFCDRQRVSVDMLTDPGMTNLQPHSMYCNALIKSYHNCTSLSLYICLKPWDYDKFDNLCQRKSLAHFIPVGQAALYIYLQYSIVLNTSDSILYPWGYAFPEGDNQLSFKNWNVNRKNYWEHRLY